mmetsp:Transcript_3455/g.6773  ORF Transcript_3455/g.6773 Transcript_3455/m.6773 type:complete len:272 (+) Transcript_3455:92-907(+)
MVLCNKFVVAVPLFAIIWRQYEEYQWAKLDEWAKTIYKETKIPKYFPKDQYQEAAPNGTYEEYYNSLYTDGEHLEFGVMNEGHYHDHRTLGFGHQQHIIASLNSYAKPNRPDVKNIIEFGCSHGFGSQWLVKEGYKAWGMDVAEKAVQLATAVRGRTCGEGTEPCFFQASVTQLPFKDKQFDAGISSDVLEHIMPEDVPQVIKEMSRVVKKFMAHQIAIIGGPPIHPAAVLPIKFWTDEFEKQGWTILKQTKVNCYGQRCADIVVEMDRKD